MYFWDSDMVEDFKFVVSVGLVYCYLFIIMDVGVGIFGDGCMLFVFFGVLLV